MSPADLAQNLDLIHSRVFRVYLDYLQRKLKWTEAEIDSFLTEIGSSRDRMAHDSTWYNLEFTDRFIHVLEEKTQDRQIAFKAGIFIHARNYSPVIHQLASAVLSIGSLYKILARFTSYFNKAFIWKVNSVGHSQADIEAVPLMEGADREYICENRKGILTGMPIIFGLQPAIVQESQCIHKGAASCRYHIQWKEESQWLWIGLQVGVSAIAGVFIGAALGLWTGIVSGVTAFVISLLVRSVWKSRRQYDELLSQNDVLDSSVKKIERKSTEMNLVAKISKLTHSMASPTTMGETIVRSVCQILEYDRALLLMCDYSRMVLQAKASYGFDDRMQELLAQTEFRLDSDNQSGFFVRVVNTKQPILIQNLTTEISKLSPRSQQFARIMGSTSFVAVPLINEQGVCQGVLAVDYITSAKQLGLSDQDLLMMLADHLAIALQNARVMGDLEANLNISKSLSDREQVLRTVFQKFVPTDLARALVQGAESSTLDQDLRGVKKRRAAILFGDIFKFSEISSHLEAEDVIDLVNTVFEEIEPLVSQAGGYVDKFMGDGLLAVFEEPFACTKGVECGLRILERMKVVNEKLIAKGYPEIGLGLGMSFGPTIMGTIGSRQRLNFSVMGEPVNFASRLEGMTRAIAANTLCIAESVKTQLTGNLVSLDWKEHSGVEIKGYGPSRFFSISSPSSSGVQRQNRY